MTKTGGSDADHRTIHPDLRRAFLAGAAALLATLAVSWLAGAAHAATDPKPGTVLSSEAMTLSANLDAVATGRRITYVSTDPDGDAIVVSAAVLTPRPHIRRAHPGNASGIVAWAHGTMGLADDCAPSRTDHLDLPGFDDYSATAAGYLGEGWTVTATDYPGLGTPGLHPYVVGESAGRSIIDSVRAARRLDPSLSAKWVVSGHSQGGQAAIFAGELADTYGAGLQLRGAIGLAPASNLDLITQGLAGTPLQGYLVMAIYGLSAVDSDVRPHEILAPPALARASVIETGCFGEVHAAFADLTADELLVGGQLSAGLTAKFAESNPGQVAGNAPVLLVQGLDDDTIPADLTRYFHGQLCGFAQPVQLTEYPGAGHVGVLAASQGAVIDYIAARFAKEPAPTNC